MAIKMRTPLWRGVFHTLCCFTLFTALSCSSAPERPAEVFALRDAAEIQLEAVNKASDRGDYEGALILLVDAERLAASTDRPYLLIRTALSRGNALFFLNRIDEADAVWSGALAEALASEERALAAICRIYIARSSIFRAPPEQRSAVASRVKALVYDELGAVKSSRYYLAQAWGVIGLAAKEERNFDEAEKAVKNSLDIHEKDRYLEQAAYDWYLIASIRSVAGNYSHAREALQQALSFDRRAENTYGLAMDWLAMGDVYTRAGQSAEAEAAYRRSAGIFRTMNLEEDALRAEARIP